MEKCENSMIYEQIRENKLIACSLNEGECVYQGESFNSSSEPTKYNVCTEKGLAKTTAIKEYATKIINELDD